MDNKLSGKHGLPTIFPVADFLGINFINQSNGHAVAEFRAGAQHANPMGTLHGGILRDLANAALGVAFASTPSSKQAYDARAKDHLSSSSVGRGPLKAAAGVVLRGRTVGLVECTIADEKHRLIARATSTCMPAAGEAAKNR